MKTTKNGSTALVDPNGSSGSTRRQFKPERYYLHGDVLEDGERWYSARRDSFEQLPAPEATPLDVLRYVTGLRNVTARQKQKTAWRYFRPADAPNVYADHPLVKAHPMTLRAAVRKAQRL